MIAAVAGRVNPDAAASRQPDVTSQTYPSGFKATESCSGRADKICIAAQDITTQVQIDNMARAASSADFISALPKSLLSALFNSSAV